MLTKLDNLHYSYRQIDGYHKAFNFVMSAREPGKTSMMWLKIYNGWKEDKRPWIFLVRNTVEITEALINSICETTINKFIDEEVRFNYNKSNFKDGIVDVFIGKDKFFRIVSLSITLRRIKQSLLANMKNVFFDEYIIDTRTQERYLPGEAFKIKEAYTTWRRENPDIKFYFVGNPYSLFNPVFVDWKVDVGQLKRNSFYVGGNYVIHWAVLNPLLKEKMLKENPLYQFDEDYAGYALDGNAKNDKNIKLDTLKDNYSLKYVLRYANINIGIYQNNDYDDLENKYHCKQVTDVSKYRQIIAFEFAELVERTALVSMEIRIRLARFKDAISKRQVTYEDVNIYYYMEDIYKQL